MLVFPPPRKGVSPSVCRCRTIDGSYVLVSAPDGLPPIRRFHSRWFPRAGTSSFAAISLDFIVAFRGTQVKFSGAVRSAGRPDVVADAPSDGARSTLTRT